MIFAESNSRPSRYLVSDLVPLAPDSTNAILKFSVISNNTYGTSLSEITNDLNVLLTESEAQESGLSGLNGVLSQPGHTL